MGIRVVDFRNGFQHYGHYIQDNERDDNSIYNLVPFRMAQFRVKKYVGLPL
jgi:hypothetical protein